MIKERMQKVSVGPTVPQVSFKEFNKVRFTHDQLYEAWKVVGPSVAFNLTKGPLWHTIVMAYLEGLSHGYDLAMEKMERND